MNAKVVIGPELNRDLTIDTVHMDKPLAEIAADAAFMEEILVIEIAPGNSDNDVPCVILNVNGVNQPIWRGYPVPVRRKYVEVLARMKETRYSQDATNYIEPEKSNQLRPRTGQSYPFQVVQDKNPLGYAWLRQILAEQG